MKKALSKIIHQQMADGRSVRISIVEKESDLGFSFNSRLLVLVEGVSFGYISKYVETEDPANIDLAKCKETIPIKNITGVTRSKDIMSLKFYQKDSKTNKKTPKLWVLKFSTESLATKWEELFNIQKTRSEVKKSVSASKRNTSLLSPSKSDLKSKPSDNNLKPKANSQIKKQFKKDFDNKNTLKKDLKEYNNNLYNSKDSDENQQNNTSPKFILPTSPKNNVARKLDFSNNPLKQVPEEQNQSQKPIKNSKNKGKQQQERKMAEQRKKWEQEQRLRKYEQQQKLRRQKQAIERQKRQLENEKKKIEMQRIQLQQQKKMKKSEQQNYKKDITVVNEDLFNIKQQSPKKRQQRNPNFENNQKSQIRSGEKPKLQGMNYYEMVNKLIHSNNDDSELLNKKQKIEEAHDYIFQMEKKKYTNQEQDRQFMAKKSVFSPKNTMPVELGWTYKQIVAENQGYEEALIFQFIEHCQQILEQVINQMHLSERRKKYRPRHKQKSFYIYELDDIEFKIALVGLKEVYNDNEPGDRDRICQNSSIKSLLNQYRNFQTLYETIKKLSHPKNNGNRMVIKVPLTCICEYQGFVAFFKVNSEFDNQGYGASGLQKRLQINLQDLSEETRVSLESFKTKGNCLILKMNSKFYRQLANETGKSHINFDYYMIQQMKVLMPPDVLYGKRNRMAANYVENYEGELYLRHQLLIGHVQASQAIVSTILSALKKNTKSKIGAGGRRFPKTNNDNNQDTAKLQQLSQNILIPISSVIKDFDDFNVFYVGPQEFTDHLHSKGVNIRYLGLIYEHATIHFTKQCILAEIAARSCKNLFRKTIQDLHLQDEQKSQQMPINKFHQGMREKTIDFFNCILGNNIDTVTIWKLLSTHSQYYFNISLDPFQIQKGVFLISLVHHCGLGVDWNHLSAEKVFNTDQFFNQDNFFDVGVKCKFYEPWLNQKQQQIYDQILRQQPSAFSQLVETYKISQQQLPQKFRHRRYYPTIRKYLANFIAPNNVGGKNLYQHLQIYQYEGYPNKSDIQIQMMELKWNLRKKKKQRYLQICNNLMSSIASFYGDYHPYYSQLYDIFAMYHRDNGQFQDSITFSKSSLVNMLQICGPNHPKVAESYYQLAISCIKAGKTDKAILNLQKAKKIFEYNEKTDDVQYASVMIKLGLLLLSQGRLKQSESVTKFSLQIFRRQSYQQMSRNFQSSSSRSQGFPYEDEKVEGYQILARIYEIRQNSQLQRNLSENCQKQMNEIKSPSNVQKILKIILYPKLSCLNQQAASSYLDIISLIPFDVTPDSYIKSFHRITRRIQEYSLLENLNNYLENIMTIEKYLAENATLKNWKTLSKEYERQTVNDFISLTEEMSYFLGEGFLTGALRENL